MGPPGCVKPAYDGCRREPTDQPWFTDGLAGVASGAYDGTMKALASTLAVNRGWIVVIGLTATAVLLRRKIVARIPGTRANLARRAARSDFLATAAERLVAVGLPDARSARIWVRSDRPGAHT